MAKNKNTKQSAPPRGESRFLKALDRIIPLYAILPALILIAFNTLAYNGNRLLTVGWPHYDFSGPLDRAIPFLHWTILFYVFFYPFFIFGYLRVAKNDKPLFYRMAAGSVISKVFCLLFFLLLPTRMPNWPSGTFEIRNFFDWLLQLIYDYDLPDNLLPSIHVLESWTVFRFTLKCDRFPKWQKVVSGVLALLIILSTLTVKQHLLVDIAAGILVSEISHLLARVFRGERVFEAIERKTTSRLRVD